MRLLVIAVALGFASGAMAQAPAGESLASVLVPQAPEAGACPGLRSGGDTLRVAAFDSVRVVLEDAFLGFAAAASVPVEEPETYSREEKVAESRLAYMLGMLGGALSLYTLAEQMETPVDRNRVQVHAVTTVGVLTTQTRDLEATLRDLAETDSPLAPRYRAQAAWLASFRESFDQAFSG